jgi:D-glycero-alpha-D-manno-heptose 1-phosphate guanylyltransferase
VTSAVILAGGLGSRLQTVVRDVPKPMAPINGRPFLEYLLDYWIGQGVNHFILSVGYKHEIIERHFTNHYKQAEIEYAVEEKPLGTGGGLLCALKYLRGPNLFLILNGDTFFEIDLEQMRLYHQGKQAAVTIALREIEANNRYASVEIDKDQKITAFNNRARTSERALINGGIYLAETSTFYDVTSKSDEPVSIEDQLYPRMLSAGKRMYGFSSSGNFIDIGIPEDYQRAANFLQRM